MFSLFSLCSLKYWALVLLVLQNSILVILIRYSRTNQTSSGSMYIASSAVFVAEIVKFVSCLVIVLFQSGSFHNFYLTIHDDIFCKLYDTIKVSLPSLLYVFQNNLLYYALSNLEASMYQVAYQIKILTTAFFSVLLLNKSLTAMQWLSLVVLATGVSYTQLSASGSTQISQTKGDLYGGFVAIVLAACTSGFAGIYFEKILKNSLTTIWIRNIQMGLVAIPLSFLYIYSNPDDFNRIATEGIFCGYNYIVVLIILLQAIGGLVVAVVVKYADNILKGFASSFSIVTSMILCYWLFDFVPDKYFIIGAALVLVSMYMYSFDAASVNNNSALVKATAAVNDPSSKPVQSSLHQRYGQQPQQQLQEASGIITADSTTSLSSLKNDTSSTKIATDVP